MTQLQPLHVYLGWDSREMCAWNVAQLTARTSSSVPLEIHRLAMPQLRAQGLYRRETTETEAGYWDVISEAPMSTGHAIARFLVPALCHYSGLALFCDGDVLFRRDLATLFALADPRYAVQVVQHHYEPTETEKMDGQIQTRYLRKNWSSVMLFNCGHPANAALTVDLVNTVPGRDLHRFCWLEDAQIGALPAEWNYLVGHSPSSIDPAIVHFTQGTPEMSGYEHVEYADDWRNAARACGYKLAKPERAA